MSLELISVNWSAPIRGVELQWGELLEPSEQYIQQTPEAIRVLVSSAVVQGPLQWAGVDW